mgnify:CR=1 FL=1
MEESTERSGYEEIRVLYTDAEWRRHLMAVEAVWKDINTKKIDDQIEGGNGLHDS